MKKVICAICAILSVAIICSGTLSAAQVELPTTLDNLLPDGEFAVVDGLTFSDFTYVFGGDMPAASQINVSSIGGNGLSFQGPFLDLPGGDGNGASDAAIGFVVTGSFTGATLAGNPSVQGAPGVASVTETFLETGLPDTADLQMDIFNNIPQPGNTPLRVEDSVDFGTTLSTARILKDILLLSESQNERATLSVIEQRFVPEPSGVALLLLGMLGLVCSRRRR